MKKAFLLLLALCLFCSCGTPEEADTSLLLDDQFDTAEFLPEYDFLNEFGKWRQLYESEAAYYLFSDTNPFLHYYDKESGISGILCGKPECNHSDTSCNAYLAGGSSLMYYDGYIYWVQQGNTLMRIKPDGTERETVQYLQGGIANSVWLHRGYIYSIQTTSSVVDGVSQNLIQLTQEVLGDAEQEAKTVLEVVGNDYFYQVVGNTVYIGIEAYTLAEDSSIASSSISLYAYDSASGSLDKLAENTLAQNHLICDMRFTNGNLFFSAYGDDSQPSLLYQYCTDTKEIALFSELDSSLIFYLGDTYIGGIDGRYNVPICFQDYQGNLLREEPLITDASLSIDVWGVTPILLTDKMLLFLTDVDPEGLPTLFYEIPLDPSEPIQSLLTLEKLL